MGNLRPFTRRLLPYFRRLKPIRLAPSSNPPTPSPLPGMYSSGREAVAVIGPAVLVAAALAAVAVLIGVSTFRGC